MMTLVKMSEETKRILIVLLLVLIILFILVGLIGALVRKIMKYQGSKADSLVVNVFNAGNITDERKMYKFAIRKNWRQLVREAWIPFLIMLVSSLILLLYCMTMNAWGVNIWDIEKTGFSTLFYNLDWDHVPTVQWFGLTIISGWPPVYSAPHFSWDAWGAYLFVPGMIVGGTWFMVCVQAYIARSFRLRKIIHLHFNPKLDEEKPIETPQSPINPE